MLSDQAFLWMVSKARPLLDFDDDYLARRVQVMKDDEARGVLIDSSGGIWGPLGRIHRKIGDDRSELVHPSAKARLAAARTLPATYAPHPYAPKNLVEYLKRVGQG